MAYEISNYSVKVTLVAGADLSALQYNFVKINSSGQAVACAAATDIPVGVLQNAPTSGQEAEVLIVGGTKIVAGAAIGEGALVVVPSPIWPFDISQSYLMITLAAAFADCGSINEIPALAAATPPAASPRNPRRSVVNLVCVIF